MEQKLALVMGHVIKKLQVDLPILVVYQLLDITFIVKYWDLGLNDLHFIAYLSFEHSFRLKHAQSLLA